MTAVVKFAKPLSSAFPPVSSLAMAVMEYGKGHCLVNLWFNQRFLSVLYLVKKWKKGVGGMMKIVQINDLLYCREHQVLSEGIYT